MSKRLQVLVEEQELEGFREAARRAGLTVSEWARQALRRAERSTSESDPAEKIAAVRRAATYSFPAPDIEQMNAEIEQGYLQET